MVTVLPQGTAPHSSPSLSPGLSQLGAGLLAAVDDIAEALVEAILAEDPSYTADGQPTREDLHRSCLDNLRPILATLAGAGHLGDPFAAPRATGHRRAEQGVPLESVLHAYRLGHRVIWDQLVLQARHAGGATLEVLVDAASEVWALVDSYSAQVAQAYRETELEIARYDDRRRDALLDALLEGRGVDRTLLAAASVALQLPQTGPLCSVVLPGTESGRAVADALSVRGLRSAWRTRADHEIGLIALGRTPVSDVSALLVRIGVRRAGLSPVVDELALSGLAARWATTALRARPEGVVELDQALPGALLASAPALAERLIERALAPVLTLAATERDVLLDTLAAWLTCGGSAGRTAEQLYCHRNTVLNRLRRIEALTGRALSDPDALVEWRLALLARELVFDAH